MIDFFTKLAEATPNLRKYLFITPEDPSSFEFFNSMAEKTNCKFAEILGQREGSLFKRLKNIFITLKQKNEGFIHLTGTDIPDFPFKVISNNQNVDKITIGPDFDGGYYYIGAKSDFDFIFDISPEGPEDVFEKTMDLIKTKNINTNVCRTWSDIDCLDDLFETMNRDRLGNLVHTREAISQIKNIEIPSFS